MREQVQTGGRCGWLQVVRCLEPLLAGLALIPLTITCELMQVLLHYGRPRHLAESLSVLISFCLP
jgi:hypothetical protein